MVSYTEFDNLTEPCALSLMRSSIKDLKLILLSLPEPEATKNMEYIKRLLLSLGALVANMEDVISITYRPNEDNK